MSKIEMAPRDLLRVNLILRYTRRGLPTPPTAEIIKGIDEIVDAFYPAFEKLVDVHAKDKGNNDRSILWSGTSEHDYQQAVSTLLATLKTNKRIRDIWKKNLMAVTALPKPAWHNFRNAILLSLKDSRK